MTRKRSCVLVVSHFAIPVLHLYHLFLPWWLGSSGGWCGGGGVCGQLCLQPPSVHLHTTSLLSVMVLAPHQWFVV